MTVRLTFENVQQGNVISTGFSQTWTNPDGKIQTGPISPGVANEYDIVTCRDLANGETQHFRMSWGSSGFNDMRGHGPVRVVGPHTGTCMYTHTRARARIHHACM